MKYNDNGTYKDIYVKTFDTLPIGAELDYDGETVPSGYVQVAEADAIIVNLNATASITTSTPAYTQKVIPLNNEYIKLGNKLTFNSTNNSVVVGAGVNHVEISASASLRNSNTTSAAERVLSIKTSTTPYIGQASFRNSYSSSNTAYNLSISPLIISVQENEEIQLCFSSETSETIKVYGSASCITYLTVKVID